MGQSAHLNTLSDFEVVTVKWSARSGITSFDSPAIFLVSLGMIRTLYVVRNSKVTPEFSKVKPRLAAIVSKSMNSLIKNQGIGDLYRMYSNSQREGIAFRSVWIPCSDPP